MGSDEAVREAISVLKVPSQVRRLRTSTLPQGTPLLLAIAAGDRHAEENAVELTGRPIELIRETAGFFIEQILLFPDADSYRMLGADRSAAPHELRNHMVLLMRWLHPDMDRSGERGHLAARVLGAWEHLKSPERRQVYDATLALGVPQPGPTMPDLEHKRSHGYRRRPIVHGTRAPATGWLRSIMDMLSGR